MAEFGEYQTGESITYEIGNASYQYPIVGVVQEMQFGNFSTNMMGAYLSKEAYEKLLEANAGSRVYSIALKLKENQDSKQVQSELFKMFREENVSVLYGVCDSENKQGRTMVCNLLIAIFMGFAAIVVFVTLFLAKFRIQNCISQEMADMGVRKALGYTSNMIITSIIMPYMVVGAITSGIGILLSYLLLPTIAHLLGLQAGFSLYITFSLPALGITLAVLLGLVFVFTYLAARKIRKLQPIYAIRGNAEYKKAALWQNLLLFFSLGILTVLVSFAGTLFYNVMVKPDNFMKALSDETASVVLQVKDADKIKESLEVQQETVKVLKLSTEKVKIKSEEINVLVCEDFQQLDNDICYQGRYPEKEDEIALGSAFAQEDGYQLGDVMELHLDGITQKYKIVGYIQSVNQKGELCAVTIEGMKRLYEDYQGANLYVYLQKGTDAGRWMEKQEKTYPEEIFNSFNQEELSEKTKEMYSSLIQAAILCILVVTILISLLILYVIIKSILVSRREEFGIYKALGYTNGQLIGKLAGELLPVSVAAIGLFSLAGTIYMRVLYQFIFSMAGAMKNFCQAPIVLLLGSGTGFLAVTYLISLWLALPLKKISAYQLMKE